MKALDFMASENITKILKIIFFIVVAFDIFIFFEINKNYIFQEAYSQFDTWYSKNHAQVLETFLGLSATALVTSLLVGLGELFVYLDKHVKF